MTQASDARKIGRRLQAASSILRAFVNCKTVRNRDASRMGFWAELYVHPSGYLGGVQLSCHVLDKPRVDDCPRLERTFHIFYQLLAGMDVVEREQFGLSGTAKDFHLLATGITDLRAEDAQAFRALEDALSECGLAAEDRRNLRHRRRGAAAWERRVRDQWQVRVCDRQRACEDDRVVARRL